MRIGKESSRENTELSQFETVFMSHFHRLFDQSEENPFLVLEMFITLFMDL